MTAFWTLIILMIGAGLLYTFWGMRRIGTPTQGAPIDLAARPGKALLIIDMQEDFTSFIDRKLGDPAYLEERMARIRDLAAKARAAGEKVITLRQVFASGYTSFLVHLLSGGRGATGSQGLGLDPRLQIQADADFEKRFGDAFSAREFEAYLKEQGIGTFVLTGLDGNYCVKNTAEGALNRGYGVEIVEEAIATLDATKWEKERARLYDLGARMISREDRRLSA